MRSFFILLLACRLSQGAPQVTFAKGTISAIPDEDHPPVNELLEVLEQDNCLVQKGKRQIVLTANCGFMRGLYRYSFVNRTGSASDRSENGKDTPLALFIEFTAFRTAQGYGFISAAPLELASQ